MTSSLSSSIAVDSKGVITLRTPGEQGRRSSFRVFRPSLFADVERQWVDRGGQIGRWTVKVRGSGNRAGDAEFQPFDGDGSEVWARAVTASRSLAGQFGEMGGIAQVYDERVAGFRIVQEYLRAWTLLLSAGEPSLALANTVEVQSLSGRTIGLVVLPAHPLRVAWHAAYDNSCYIPPSSKTRALGISVLNSPPWTVPCFQHSSEPGRRGVRLRRYSGLSCGRNGARYG